MKILSFLGYCLLGVLVVAAGNVLYSALCVKFLEHQTRKNSEELVEMD
jgi:hypothetical protein